MNGLALIAVGVWGYIALNIGEQVYDLSGLPACGRGENMIDCARSWLPAVVLVLVAIAVLDFLRRQTSMAARQTGIFDRLREISEAQHKASSLKELAARRLDIENATDSIGREFMKLQFTADLAVARNTVVTLQGLIEHPAFVDFTSAELRFEFRKMLETIKKRHAEGCVDLKRLPVESLLDRLFERSLEAQAGWETTYEGLVGEPIARPACERLEKWRADKEAVRPRVKK